MGSRLTRLEWFQIGLGVFAICIACLVYLVTIEYSHEERNSAWQVYWMDHEIPHIPAPPNGKEEWDYDKMRAEFDRAHPEFVASSHPRAIAATCDFASGYVVVAYGIHGIGKLIRRRKRHT